MSYIRVRDLRFRYPGASHDALALPSLDIDRPGLVAITGPSGAGKSTLIELLAGTINERYSGSLEVLGQEWSELRTDRARQLHLRRIALIPQDLGLLPNQTPRQMLVQALLDAGVARSACDERVSRALAQMEITAHAERRIAELSGGQQQRVAIARALARNVDLILADEPTASLNAALVEEAVAVFRRIALTVPIVMVTHDPSIAAQCDRQIRLSAPTAAAAAPVLILPTLILPTPAPAPAPVARPALRPVAAAGSAAPLPRRATPSGVSRALPPPRTVARAASAAPSGAAASSAARPAWRVPRFGVVMSAAATGLVALVGAFAVGPLAPSASQRPAPVVTTVRTEKAPAASPAASPAPAPQPAAAPVAPPAPSPSPAVTHPVAVRAAPKPAPQRSTSSPAVIAAPAPAPAAVVAPAPATSPATAAPSATNALAWWIAMSQLLNSYGGPNGTGMSSNPTPTTTPTPTQSTHP